jgi:hypothetical protein
MSPAGRDRVGTFHVHVILQAKHIQLPTASTVHVTNLTPPGSECNPNRAYGQRHQFMTPTGIVQSDTRGVSATLPTCGPLLDLCELVYKEDALPLRFPRGFHDPHCRAASYI